MRFWFELGVCKPETRQERNNILPQACLFLPLLEKLKPRWSTQRLWNLQWVHKLALSSRMEYSHALISYRTHSICHMPYAMKPKPMKLKTENWNWLFGVLIQMKLSTGISCNCKCQVTRTRRIWLLILVSKLPGSITTNNSSVANHYPS